jgi:hypothetical protein
MALRIAYYDSPDPRNRRHCLELWLADGERGKVYETERAHPSDIWPPATELGTHGLAAFEGIAASLGLTSREETSQ